MIEAFKIFEKCYLSKREHKEFTDFSKKRYKKFMELFDTGCCIPFPERNAEGQRIILLRFGLWEPEHFTPVEFMQMLMYVCIMFLEEEETQIAGIAFIFDAAGVSTRHLVTPMFVKNFMTLMITCSPIRYKDSYIINLPSYAKFIVDLALSMMSGKLSMRISSLDDPKDILNHIDQSLLPKEYGGTETCAEMKNKFLAMNEEKYEEVIEHLDVDIDWGKVPSDYMNSKEIEEGIGSFRKLEID